MWSLGLCWIIPAQSCVIKWSPGLCRNIHVVTWSVLDYSCTVLFLCVHLGLCRNMPAEPEPFDLCACSCMSYLVGYLKPDLE